MRLIPELAVTHIRGRGRQTVVAVIGVAVGVGFSIAMAALMQGSQEDFIEQLVNSMPHVQITDDQRTPPRQPAVDEFETVAMRGLRPRDDRRGIINPTAPKMAEMVSPTAKSNVAAAPRGPHTWPGSGSGPGSGVTERWIRHRYPRSDAKSGTRGTVPRRRGSRTKKRRGLTRECP